MTRHFRPNEDCGVLEELEPIDINLKYDFNYQQINILTETTKILPVSQAMYKYIQSERLRNSSLF